MKFTLSWLKEYLETVASLDEICDTLNRIGLEVEDVIDRSRELRDFNCVLVEEVTRHPNSDHLHICRVRVAGIEDAITVVCGAPNVVAGLKTVFAPIGSVLPGKDALRIEKIRIRGVDSNGMLCSEAELGLGSDHRGIVELDRNTKIGANVADIFGLSDPIVNMSITANRGDCLGVYGIARDLAATGIGRLGKLRKPSVRVEQSSAGQRSLALNSVGCPRFLFREIKNIKNCRSPEWLENRLKSVGLTPRNALVDIGNYVMFSFGKPMHFYDLSALEGNLSVRDSREGEVFVDLFGNEHRLPSGAVVICDERKILCLGGIVGSNDCCVSEKTDSVILESAIFDPIEIARTKKILNIQTDAGYRFERGSDYEMVDFALEYASDLVGKICGGNFGRATNSERGGYRQSLERFVRMDYGHVEKRLGLKIARKNVDRILKSLGYGVEKEEGRGDSMILKIPLFRNVVECREDVIDDIIRIYGYANLSDGDFMDPVVHEKEDSLFYRGLEDSLYRVRKRLAGNGMVELITYSFLRREDCSYFSEVNEELDLINPIISDLSHMRQNLIPNILNTIVKNGNRGFNNMSFFEIGHVYRECALDREDNVVCGVRYGDCESKDCHGEAREFDIFDVKRDLFDVLAIFGLSDDLVVKRETPKYYHQGRSGAVFGKDAVLLGYFGELHPAVAMKFSLKTRPMIFEFFIDHMPRDLMIGSGRRVSDFIVNDLQPITRDFSFILDEKIEVGNVMADVAAIDSLISDVSLFDVYSYGDGKKSIGLTVEIQPVNKTLNRDEIEVVCSKVLGLMSGRYKGVLRDR
ncbi:MAG: phenylalanine--tRNA ligase subunit beta [Rickettsiales bacterium]|nr:phenylalanine--tRNA ligase subunit beta [Rickettsiales bacterium]